MVSHDGQLHCSLLPLQRENNSHPAATAAVLKRILSAYVQSAGILYATEPR